MHVQEEAELAGPDGSQAIVLEEGRTLQVTLLSNRAEAYLRAKPPKFAEALKIAKRLTFSVEKSHFSGLVFCFHFQ